MMAHFDEITARRMMRKMVASSSLGTWSTSDVTGPAHAAVRAGTLRVVRRQDVDHLHRIFLRLKSNGKEYRMLVDATDQQHPNAFNARMPRHLKPPGMMPVALVILIVLSGEAMGVDDVRSAFHQLGPLAPTVRRAMGSAIRRRGAVPMYVQYDVVPQGGSWSATVCQSVTLVLAHETEWMPRRKPLHVDGAMVRTDEVSLRRVIAHEVPAAEWVEAAFRNARVVHVDDVVSSGASAEQLDIKRRAFRAEAERRWSVQWKEFHPSAPSGDALGMRFDCSTKTWGLKQAWVEKLMRQLDDVDARIGLPTDDQRLWQWMDGVAAWMSLVLQQPAVMWALGKRRERSRMTALMRKMAPAAARYSDGRHPALRMKEMLQPVKAEVAVITDACGRGWAGAASDGFFECGRWWRCGDSGNLSPTECCRQAVQTEAAPNEMYMAEMLASARILHRTLRRMEWRPTVAERAQERNVLVLSDNETWCKSLAKGHSSDPVLIAVLQSLHDEMVGRLSGSVTVSVAHVRGEDNPADGPSRDGRHFQVHLDAMPPHAKPRRSVLGQVRTCVTEMCTDIAAEWLSCGMRHDLRAGRSRPSQCPHVVGCLCVRAGE